MPCRQCAQLWMELPIFEHEFVDEIISHVKQTSCGVDESIVYVHCGQITLRIIFYPGSVPVLFVFAVEGLLQV